MKKIEKIFPNALEAARPISCETQDEAIQLLNCSNKVYQDYCNSDKFKITIVPTGNMVKTNGYPTNEVLLTIEWE